jgi:hypothetical protein
MRCAQNAWFGLSSQFALLGLEAQRVIELRLMRLAAGGALAESETSHMITEKVAALGEDQTRCSNGDAQGVRQPPSRLEGVAGL